MVVFGAPRIGDADFAQAYRKQENLKWAGFLHEQDVVGLLPPWLCHIRHPIEPATSFQTRLLASLVESHSMEGYLTSLRCDYMLRLWAVHCMLMLTILALLSALMCTTLKAYKQDAHRNKAQSVLPRLGNTGRGPAATRWHPGPFVEISSCCVAPGSQRELCSCPTGSAADATATGGSLPGGALLITYPELNGPQ